MWLQRTPEPIGQQRRGFDLLAELSFDVEHRSGLKHNNSDALYRKPCRQCGWTDRDDIQPIYSDNCRAVTPTEDCQANNLEEDKFNPWSLRKVQLESPHIRPIVVIMEEVLVLQRQIFLARIARNKIVRCLMATINHTRGSFVVSLIVEIKLGGIKLLHHLNIDLN